ncbi:MAG: phospholipid/cholesterol/gamma-HCH transport system substrate-binding protein, partial [Nocardioidaceae bacterium]|nr:phospholipid/cholesterol/gamma-HCH transport system substrate-binding protein [Nocardioidaceae bacterium]
MKERRVTNAVVGVGYLVVIAALITLSLAVYNHAFTSYLSVYADVPTAGDSLPQDARVMVRGILVGTVDDVTTDGDTVRLHLQLNPDQASSLPSNLTVQLLPRTLFGGSYVNLVVPANPTGRLQAGDVLHQDSSPGTVALERVFTNLQAALTIVQPDKLQATLNELAGALRGHGKSLGETLDIIGHYLHVLTPEIPKLATDLDRLTVVAHDYTTAAPDLLRGLAVFTSTSKLFVRENQNYVDLLSSLTTTGQRFGHFVGTSQDQIIGLAADSLPSLEITKQYSSEFPCLASALVDLVPRVNKAFGVGTSHPGARVILHVTKPARPYISTPGEFSSTAGPRCPSIPATALAQTALSGLPGVPGTGAPAPTGVESDASPTTASTTGTGIGSVNSPQENQLIAELVGPQAG